MKIKLLVPQKKMPVTLGYNIRYIINLKNICKCYKQHICLNFILSNMYIIITNCHTGWEATRIHNYIRTSYMIAMESICLPLLFYFRPSHQGNTIINNNFVFPCWFFCYSIYHQQCFPYYHESLE